MHRLPAHVRQVVAAGCFDGCSRRQIEQLATVGTVIDVVPGRRLWSAGEAWAQAVIVVEGALGVLADDGTARVLTAGEGCGWRANGDRSATSEDVEALTGATVVVFGRREVASVRSIAPLVATKLATAGATAGADSDSDSDAVGEAGGPGGDVSGPAPTSDRAARPAVVRAS